MRIRPLASTIALLVAVAAHAPAIAQNPAAALASPAPVPVATIDPALADALARTPAGARLPVIAVLREQVPVEEIASLASARGSADVSAARARVMARLRAHASRAQAPLAAALAQAEKRGEGLEARPLWIANAIGFDATPALVRALARRTDIASLRLAEQHPVFDRLRPVTPAPSGGAPRLRLDLPQAAHPGEIDWGVARIGAPRVWSEFGLDGTGVVVAIIDAGVCLEHPDIAGRIWVNPGEDRDGDGVVMDADDVDRRDNDGNGFVDDLVGWDFAQNDRDPGGDLSGHGSHCAGTIAGDGTSGFRAGVAPGARVMVLRAGLSTADELSVWRAIEYAAANGARVISLSLGWRHAWRPDRAMWRRVVDNATAMGAIVVAAAGNEGQGLEPDNVRTPADVPAAIAVGATDPNERAAAFSARGPVTWADVAGYGDFPLPDGLVKPDLVAPGVSTRSHARCQGYGDESGTSMATPHVAGALALLLEADPALDRSRALAWLAETAIDLGDAGPDPTFGHGRVDIHAAVRRARAPLVIAAHRLDDGEAGDGDGALEPGEDARLWVTLENRGTEAVSSCVATLTDEAEGPAVAVLDDAPLSCGRIAPGARATLAFRVRGVGACGAEGAMRVDAYDAQGVRSRGRFRLDLGAPTPGTLFEDDAERDRGWTVSGDARAGEWVRVEPRGTRVALGDANPPEDASPAGRFAFVTGNGGLTAASDDLDAGETRLVSPAIATRGWRGLVLEAAVWVYRDGRARWPADEGLAIEVSDDEGLSWSLVAVELQATRGWKRLAIPIDELRARDAPLRLRARAFDEGEGPESVVEAGLDEIALRGQVLVCE